MFPTFSMPNFRTSGDIQLVWSRVKINRSLISETNVLDPEDVNKFYRDLELSKDTFFENEVAVARFQPHLR
jgi:hypothetical protein